MSSTTTLDSSRSVALPLEIVEKILKDVADLGDRRNLLNCSLVSEIFLDFCRSHLFRDIKLVLEPDTVKRQGRPSELSSIPFISFLVSNPRVSSMVQTMHITGSEPHPDTTASQWTTIVEILSKLPPKLTHLRHLIIQSAFFTDWTILNSELKNILTRIHNLSTLQYLELHYMTMSTHELLALIKIPKMTLIGVVSSTKSNPAEAPFTEDTSSSPIVKSLLRDLKIIMKRSQTASFLSSIVTASAETLNSLQWISSPYNEMERTHLDLITLRNLPLLVFLTACIPLDDSGIGDLVTLFGTASEGKNSKLKKLEIVCDYQRFPEQRTIDNWDWQGVDTTLAGPAFVGLETVKISIKRKVYPKYKQPSTRVYESMLNESLSLFRSMLPTVSEKGVLIVGGEML